MSVDERLILLTGATGYVGGRLLHRFERQGRRVRCLVRRPEPFAGLDRPRTEYVQGDVFDPASLAAALAGIHTAYYLIHSMGATEGEGFEARDREAAGNFAAAARSAGVRRIVYLGGLGDPSHDLSAHLRSRHEVGRLLATYGGSVIELRASIVLGTGSLSFELVRALVERLPVMITPRWVRVEAQPILVTDVLDYLEAAADLPPETSEVVEIGGADRCTYGAIMKEYARQRGLRRLMIGVPFLTPHLSSLWLGLVTPLYARVGRKLVGSIRNPTVVRTDVAQRLFPDLHPAGLQASIERVLRKENESVAETRWCDAISAAGEAHGAAHIAFGPRLLDKRSIYVDVPPADAFRPVRRIGGKHGWYYANWMWRVRGYLDLLVGGVGLRRGRRDPEHVRIGEPLDFWRVEAYEPDRRLLLRAEMKVPGRAWLEFQVEPEAGGSRIHQTAVFDPRGLSGRLYWWSVYPLHGLIFAGMLRRIGERAVAPPAPAGGRA